MCLHNTVIESALVEKILVFIDVCAAGQMVEFIEVIVYLENWMCDGIPVLCDWWVGGKSIISSQLLDIYGSLQNIYILNVNQPIRSYCWKKSKVKSQLIRVRVYTCSYKST
jgi:hypothetical protein